MKLNPIYIALILIVIITIFISCFLGRSVYEGIDETTKGTEPPANEPPANEPPANEPPKPASPPEVMGAVTGALNSISDAASRVPELNKTDKKTQNSTDIDDLSITNSEADKIIKWIETSKDNMKTNKVSLNKPITHSHRKTISSPPIVSQETVQPASSDKGGVGGHQSYSQYNEPSVKRRREIPPGDDDLYILKSQIVPPVCPACPANISCGKSEPPQPCPACARCPEPAFDCKKVPNYRSGDARNLPKPVLNDFSSFGM